MLPEAATAGQVVRVRYRKVYTVQRVGGGRDDDPAAVGRAHPAAGVGGACVSDSLPAAVTAAEHGAERPGLVQGAGGGVSAAV